MGWLDALFDPTKNTDRAFGNAISNQRSTNAQTNPFYSQSVNNGTAAGSRLSQLLGLQGAGAQQQGFDTYLTSPAFDAQFDAGQRAIKQSAGATGNLQSGATAKALQGFGQNLYAQDFNTHLGQLAGVQAGGYQGAAGLQGGSTALQRLMLGQGEARDAGNQAVFGNTVGLATTALGALAGMPGGRLFGGAQPGPSPYAYGQIQAGRGGLF